MGGGGRTGPNRARQGYPSQILRCRISSLVDEAAAAARPTSSAYSGSQTGGPTASRWPG